MVLVLLDGSWRRRCMMTLFPITQTMVSGLLNQTGVSDVKPGGGEANGRPEF
jgi:hypothetical protein